jgi:hypothetical protein
MVFLQKKDNIKDGGNNGGNNGGGTPPADTATLKVVVFHDVDRDRVRDSGEPGVSGVKIQVDPTLLGEETITGTTDSTGEYLFELEEGRSFYVSLLNAPVTYQHPLPPRQLITLLKNRANTVTFPLTTKPTVEDPCPPEQPDDAAIKSLMPAGDFSFIGCHLLRLIQGNGGPTLHPPTATHPVNMTFADDSAGNNAFVVNVNGTNVTILKQAPEVFRLASSHQELDFDPRSPFFYQDDHKNYFVSLAEYINPFEVLYAILTGQVSTFGPINLEQFKRKSLLFAPHFHAYVCNFLQDLSMSGVPALMNLQTQQRADSGSISIDGQAQAVPSGVNFWNRYQPNITLKFGDSSPVFPFALPKEVVEFGYAEAYASYNWELFFHAPLLIATRLSKNQRFEEAQRWFHYIFDPTDNSSLPSPARFWKTLPFFEAAKGSSIQELMTILANQNDHSETRNELVRQVDAWKKDPFNPHLIARFRTSAYQKSVVMKYLDNLIEWGDQLFRQDTIESINEATQLYILAAQILGRKPETMPLRNRPEVHTYNSLAPILDSFSNAIVQLENQTPSTSSSGSSGGQQGNGFSSVTTITTLYFCIPKNDKLLEYWDRTADRLFKIRHCMNIAGVVRELPLFEPPIDPGLLVRARAAGVDLSSALSDINAAPPLYRFQVMGQKAQEFCNDLKILGGALLSAIEKRDAEALALLRTSQESKILREVQQVREQQIVEARHAQEALERAKDATSSRQKYYSEREFINQWEGAQLALTTASTVLQVAAQVMQLTAAAVNNIPDFYTGGAGAMGSPLVFTFIAGGTKVSTGLNSAAQAMNILASVSTTLGSLSGAMGSYQRRADDWKFQADVAGKEIEQIERQILGAEVRGAIAEKELDTHKQQIENSKQVDEFMRGKFSNQDLYDWTIGQLSSIYFQSYQLAYDLAKRAEQAFRRELGVRDSSYIQFGYWDSLKKGLLAGERLSHDLKRMEAAYLDQNKREFEITKHVSLASLDPMALIALKEKKECFITLPEVLFDIDHPGQYMRRLKLVSVTVPCVTGPYTSVNCKLTLLKSSIRASSSAPGNYARGTNDTRFMDLFGAIESVVTSNAQNDSGLFEPNMRDERYLPFEGSGAISDWRIELPANFPQFDYDTISDVILHIRYTARDGGGTLKQKVVAELTTAVNAMTENLAGDGTTLFRSFSSRQEFSNQWYSFFNPTDAETSHKFNFNVSADRFPSMFRDKTIQLKAVHLFLKLKDGVSYQDSKQLPITLNKSTTTYPTKQFVLSGSPVSTLAYSTNAFQPQQTVGAWSLDVNRTAIPDWLRMKMPTGGDEIVKINSLDHYRLNSDLIDDVYMVWEYQIA